MEIVIAAAMGVLTILGAFFGAKRGADATIKAAQIAERSTQSANRIALAQALMASSDPRVSALATQMLVIEAKSLGPRGSTEETIRNETRDAEMEQWLDRLRNMGGEGNQPPTVGHEDPPGGYL